MKSWKYGQHNTVMQSSMEAKYITPSESAKEQKFTQMLLQEISDNETPRYIYWDNEVSIFLAKNKEVSNKTEQIDIREHFIR